MGLLKKINFTLVMAMAYYSAQAQSDVALFMVSPSNKICLGEAIQVTDGHTDDPSGSHSEVTYFFGDGSSTTPPDADPTHTYASTGTFNLKQILPVSSNPAGFISYTLPIKVVATTPLSATYTVCGGGRINLSIADTRFDSYDVDFGDGTGTTNVSSDPSGTTVSIHVYTIITTYSVSIKGKFSTGHYCPVSDFTLSVTPIAAVPKPEVIFMETMTEDPSNGVLNVQVIKDPTFDYEWDLKRIGFSYNSNLGTISKGSGTSTLVLDKTTTNPFASSSPSYPTYTFNTQQNSYCIRLATTSACGREIVSDEICSVTKFTATVADLENDLTWASYAGSNPSSVDVMRDNSVLTSLGATASAYNDGPLPCNVPHCYRIRQILSTSSTLGAQYSLGIQKCITSTSLSPRPELTNLNSTVSGSSITVSFDPPVGYTAKSYTLLEEANGGTFSPVASNAGTPTSFTVTNRNTTSDLYTYKVNYTDICNLSPASITQLTRPIRVNLGLAEDGTVGINWTTYFGSTSVTNYTIEVRDENGILIKTIPGGSGTSATDLLTSTAGELFYSVIGDNGTPFTTSAPVELVLSPAVYVPDAFSPNGDGSNDFFELKGRFIKSINLSVFNRWGEPVFHSTDIKDQWDGKVNGADALVGTYAYTLDVTGQKGEVIKHKGTITLVR